MGELNIEKFCERSRNLNLQFLFGEGLTFEGHLHCHMLRLNRYVR